MKRPSVALLVTLSVLLPLAHAGGQDERAVTTPLAPTTGPSPVEVTSAPPPGLSGFALLTLVALAVLVVALVVIASRSKRRLP